MKKTALITSLLCMAATLLSHECWLEPQYFIFSRGEEINIRFRVGEDFTGENWTGNQEKVRALKLYFSDVTDNLSDQIGSKKGDSVQFKIFEEGTAMVTFNSTNSYTELNASAFNNYLLEDGITEAIDYRKARNETDSIGKEFYQRSVKTIVQIGLLKTAVPTKKTDLVLDIVPLENPYRIRSSDTLRMQVFFKGEPLPGKRMRLWHKLAGKVTLTKLMTNEQGIIHFPVSPAGEWMVSGVAMMRLKEEAQAQWQSYWGSVTWGYTTNPRKQAVLRGFY